ncbi:hypothetical protein AB0395_03550 [Streptosporangium sp. NPDC051023]|uniref:hypothetical protein n=1 Tax=Streptosporangium sp. NPDC051023 TaxID=3155410 RepID=UPI003450362D
MNAPFVGDVEPVDAVQELRAALAEHRIAGDVHYGYGLALVSVRGGLTIWCDGQHFRWRVGWNQKRRRAVYNWHPALEPARAARRIALYYAGLRKQRAHRTEEAS